MDALLSAIASSLPDLIKTNGPLMLMLLASIAGNVFQYLDHRKRERELEERALKAENETKAEIKAGIALAQGFERTFNEAITLVGASRRRVRP